MARKVFFRGEDPRRADVATLLELAHQKSKADRRALFLTVRDLFLEGDEDLNDRERALMGDILRQLIGDMETSVRKDLAEKLATFEATPRALAFCLANGTIKVTHSMLLHSELLQDFDLIEIVRHRTRSHQLAVAMRRNIGEDVSQAVADTGDPDVITALLRNEDAAISRSLMEYFVEESKRVNSFQDPLVHRSDLPNDLAQKMYWWVSATLRKHILESFDVDPTVVDDAIDSVVEGVLRAEENSALNGDAAERAAEELAKRSRLDENVLLHALGQGEVALFEAALAKLSGLAIKMTRRLVYQLGGEGLAVACRSMGLSATNFAKIYRLTRSADPTRQDADQADIDRACDFFSRLKVEDAKAVVGRWTRNSEYNRAIKSLEGAP